MILLLLFLSLSSDPNKINNPAHIPHACRLLNFEQGVVTGMQGAPFAEKVPPEFHQLVQ